MDRMPFTEPTGSPVSLSPVVLLKCDEAPRVTRETLPYRFLLWGALLCLLARAWQHIKYDPPFRALLWSQERMEGFVIRWIGMDWNTYATSSDETITTIVGGFGWFYFFAALSLLFFRRFSSIFIVPVGLATAGLVFLAYLQCIDANSRVGEFVEQASQSGSLFLLILCVYQAAPRKILLIAKVCVACTFLGHGLFAIGFYEVPAFWVYMVRKILPLSETGASAFLKVAGAIDIILAAGIFFPSVGRYFLAYACFWGFVTAAARLPGIYTPISPEASALRALFEFAVRSPHWTLPLFILLSAVPSESKKLP